MKNHHINRVVTYILWVMCLLSISSHALANLGIAKSAANSGRQVTLNFYLENLSTTTAATGITFSDDLDTTFGAGNYSIISAPQQTSGPVTLTLNALFDGSMQTGVITGGSLQPGERAVISTMVELSNIVDLGSGLGIYSNQVTINSNEFASDLSDAGNDPDPNGNGDPGDAGEDDPTIINVISAPRVGLAKAVMINGTDLTFILTLENLGNIALQNFNLQDDLDAVFGAGNFAVISAPAFIDDPGTLTLNAGFDGSANNGLISSGTLAINDTAQIEFVVDVTTVSDQGSGFGVYSNQAAINAQSPTAQMASDLSDQGLFIDANNNGNANEAGENDPTVIVIGEEPLVGLAKNASVNESNVTIDFYLENFGNSTLSSLSLIDDLNAVFGLGNYFISSAPVFIDDPGTITLNNNYDGNFDRELLNQESSTLAVGDTAQIQMQVRVLQISDQGMGIGVYSNQALVSADSPNGVMTLDFSDDGTDPDPNGNGNPDEAGENDATLINVARIGRIGIAKEYVNVGNAGGNVTVELLFTITNYGNEMLSNISVTDDLNAVYGASNFLHTLDPELVAGNNTLTYNSAFNGSTNTTMVTNGAIAPGESVVFRIRHLVVNLTDQGFGLGIYQNQVTVIATDSLANPVSDVSHEGDDPDANGDGNPAEMDPTVIDVNGTAAIGMAIDASVVANNVTLDFYFENLGDIIVNELATIVNLDDVFGEGNYTILTPPSFIDDPGTVTINPSYDGSGEKDFLDLLSSSLAAGDTAQVQMVVTVANVTDSQGLGIGNYSIQSTLDGKGAQGQLISDVSDFATDPDTNGNNNANEAGENDVTTLSIVADTLLGVALDDTVAGNVITYDVYLESFGPSTLSNLSLEQSLDTAFGAGNYQITAVPSLIVDPGTLTFNGAFDGSSDTEILDPSSTLASGATAQIQFQVQIDNESDQGNGFGIYNNQLTTSGTLPTGVRVTDVSDDGIVPDSNGNNNPSDSDENDPTTSVVAGNPAIGLALRATVTGTLVTMEFTIENLGDSTLTNIFMENPLNPVFGANNYSVVSQPSRISGADTLTLVFQFFGFSVFDVLVGGGFIRPGESETFRVQVNITNVVDVGNGLGVYLNGLTISATGPDGTMVTDTSDEGTDPDTNGNGNANEAGENDQTTITIGDEANIGLATDVSVIGQTVTMDFYLENFGASLLNNVDLPVDLDAIFGAGNYSINTAASFVDDPGTIVLNGGYNGSASTGLITSGTSTLASMDTAQIRLVIDVTNVSDVGLGFGQYSLNPTVVAAAPLGTVATDVTDDGTDPDPNSNGFANDEGESDPSLFSVGFSSVGLAKSVTLDPMDATNRTFIISLLVENLGFVTVNGIQVRDDLDSVFGAGNYALTSAPDFSGDGRDLAVNGNYDGSNDTNIFDPNNLGSLPAGVQIIVNFSVRVDIAIDGGSGLGVYSNQALLTANSPVLSDLSDDGTNPDSDNDNLSDGVDEDDPSIFMLPAPMPPGFSMSFVPSSIPLTNGVSQLTYTIDNSDSAFDVNSLAFTNNLPAGLEVATPSNLSNTCNGTVTAVEGSSTVTLTGGMVLVDDSCIIRLNVSPTAAGNLMNLTGDLTSSAGNSGTASATLFVDGLAIITPPANVTQEATGPLTAVSLGTATVVDDVDVGLVATPDNTGPFPVGDTTVTWSVMDSVGNMSTAMQTVTITDNTAPVITLNGPAIINLDAGDLYVEQGAMATDLVDDDMVLTGNIVISGTVDTTMDGTYMLDYDVMDSAMNSAMTVTRTVIVTDNAPMVTAPGDIMTEATGPLTVVNIGNASVTDDLDMGLMATPDNPGPYPLGMTTVTWNVTDSAMNMASDTQTITVVDTTPPVITLNGGNINLDIGDIYMELGATATDLVDDDMIVTANISITGTVDTSIAGTNMVNYDVMDATGNMAMTVTRLVIVADNPPVVTAPIDVTMEATGPLTAVTLGTATVVDDLDVGLVATPDNPGPFPVGMTVVNWNVTDSAMNMASDQQTVTITDTTMPVLTLIGAGTINLDAGDVYNELGAMATDLVDDDVALTANIVITGNVDTGVANTYIVNYDVMDTAGNSAMQITRLVVVTDNAPVITPPANITTEATAPLTPVALGTATVVDDLDVGLVATADNLGPYPVGLTTITWSVTDSASNMATAQQTVTVTDNTAPVISLVGAGMVNLLVGDTYNEEGATATDLVDDDATLTAAIVISGTVDTSTEGTYTVSYDVTDTAGNNAVTVERTVIVSLVPEFSIGGQLNGLLAGNSIILQNNALEQLSISADGAFTFVTLIEDGNTYDVTILTQPENQFCTVINGQGTVNGGPVSDVMVDCTNINLILDISDVNFGNVFIASNNTETITLTNSATAGAGVNGNNSSTDVIISAINNPVAPFSIEGGSCTAVPVTLASGESCTLEVGFNPIQPGNFNSSLTIVSNAISSPDVINLAGMAGVVLIPTLNVMGLVFLIALFMLSFYFMNARRQRQ